MAILQFPVRKVFWLIWLVAIWTLASDPARAAETCDPMWSLDAGPANFVVEKCPTTGNLGGYLHFENEKAYITGDLFTSMNFTQFSVGSGRSFIPIELPRGYYQVWQFRERYADAWVRVSGAVVPNGCDEEIWRCPETKALFRATGVELVQPADYFRLAEFKKTLWQGTSPIREVPAGDRDHTALVALGQTLAAAVKSRDPRAAKALFPEVASDALYEKYLKPGARANWLLFSPERSIGGTPFKLYRLGSREADVDRVIAFACYNHDPKHADVWPDSYFDLTFAHVGDPFICYPLVFDDGKWSVNFHALL